MNNILTYKGFIGSVNFSADDNVFFGKIEGINDLITFEGESVDELKQAFYYMVDEHIKDCKCDKIPVEKSYKGNFNVRLTPELHRKAVIAAKLKGRTLNAFVKDAIEKAMSL
ncbi:MAG: type II toxin-antitoxin system HicB family antitoxin [Prevotellaceae bacterium]|jgi:predicted HicB family RNase H-like nuclease|nr:type II toxin-antitoxin system HicB family antitoxin [Prevotellaceae bacterium]